MSDLYDRIQTLCKQKGVSGSKMCLDLGMSKSTLSEMKHGRQNSISLLTAQKFAKYLGISIEELCGEDPKCKSDIKKQPILLDGLSDEKIELVKFAISVPDDKIKWLLQVMKTILEAD